MAAPKEVDDRQRFRSGLQAVPVSEQLGLTQLSPCLHQSSLTARKATGDQFYGIEPVHGLIVTVIGMEMGRMVRPHFAIHANNDPVEATELRHSYSVRAATSNVSSVPRTLKLISGGPPDHPYRCTQAAV